MDPGLHGYRISFSISPDSIMDREATRNHFYAAPYSLSLTYDEVTLK